MAGVRFERTMRLLVICLAVLVGPPGTLRRIRGRAVSWRGKAEATLRSSLLSFDSTSLSGEDAHLRRTVSR